MRKLFKTAPFKYLLIICTIALLAPVLSNEKPLFVSMNGKWLFPAFSSNAYIYDQETSEQKLITTVDWRKQKTDRLIMPLIPYSPLTMDPFNLLASPFDQQFSDDNFTTPLPLRYRHWLGTDRLGHDVFSQLIYGLRTALLAGCFSMLIAFLIGIFLGVLSGYLGNHKLHISLVQLILISVSVFIGGYYAFLIGKEVSIVTGILFFMFMFIWPLLIRKGNKIIGIPLDTWITALISIFISLPRLLLLMVLAMVLGPSLTTLICIIGFTSWTEIARLARVETLKVCRLNYISAAEISGLPPIHIWNNHLLPNILTPIKPILIYGITTAVLLEAGLSFIGAGTSPEVASWGKMMFEGKQNYEAWWLVLFPGFSLFYLLFSFRKLASIDTNNLPENPVDVNKI